MPSPIVWNSRRPLYKLTLVVLMVVTPINLVSVVLPYWLRTKALALSGTAQEPTTREVVLTYGVWSQCSDDFGCHDVHDDIANADVGAWMYPIKLFMVLSVLCHVIATMFGALQNFLPREYIRRWRGHVWHKLVHRDCPYTEDIGFIGGFLGLLSCIIFMLCTKERVSDGAHYHWCFAFAFLSSTLSVIATLTLTKTHVMTVPRPPSAHRPSPPPQPEPAVSWRPHTASGADPVVRPGDIQLQERRSRSEGINSSRRSNNLFDSFTTIRRRSRSGSRSGSRSRSRSRERSRGHGSNPSGASQSRLVRSPELENIPAAVAPYSVPLQSVSGGHSRVPVTPSWHLNMDSQQRSSSLPGHTTSSNLHSPAPAHSPSRDTQATQARSAKGTRSGVSRCQNSGHTGTDFHRTQSEAVVEVSPEASSRRGSSGPSRDHRDTRDVGSVALTHRL